ncbi:hypothetical protein EYF80_029824 [Liparis tanakae]|uniref:Uncharacterized protein n=1 Tax=Liparis tanakae TaxID=230148 RepID=A0A4Z2H4Y8_9TELE|nr:hypothetical protein EYF80_029824 [Liparis tanakae]
MPSYFRTSARRQGAARRDRQSAALKELEQEEEEEEEWRRRRRRRRRRRSGWKEGRGSDGFTALYRGGQQGGRGHKFNCAEQTDGISDGRVQRCKVTAGVASMSVSFSEIRGRRISMLSSKWQSTKTSIRLLIEETARRVGRPCRVRRLAELKDHTSSALCDGAHEAEFLQCLFLEKENPKLNSFFCNRMT